MGAPHTLPIDIASQFVTGLLIFCLVNHRGREFAVKTLSTAWSAGVAFSTYMLLPSVWYSVYICPEMGCWFERTSKVFGISLQYLQSSLIGSTVYPLGLKGSWKPTSRNTMPPAYCCFSSMADLSHFLHSRCPSTLRHSDFRRKILSTLAALLNVLLILGVMKFQSVQPAGIRSISRSLVRWSVLEFSIVGPFPINQPQRRPRALRRPVGEWLAHDADVQKERVSFHYSEKHKREWPSCWLGRPETRGGDMEGGTGEDGVAEPIIREKDQTLEKKRKKKVKKKRKSVGFAPRSRPGLLVGLHLCRH